jgi:MtN3 and saliva related transmembrane protein
MSTTVLALAAATWGLVMALAPILQIRTILRRRSSRDVSMGYLAVLLLGFALWAAYGASSRNLALIVPNSLAFCTGIAALAVAARFRG